MNNTQNYIKLALLYVLITAAQILVFNNLQLSSYLNTYIYLAIIMALPFGMSKGVAMTIAFAVGITIDLFCDTPGMHAAACVLVAFMRPRILKLIATSSEYRPDAMPGLRSYGLQWYVKYSVMMIVLHHTALLFIENFDHIMFWATALRIVLSSASTFIFLIIIQFMLPSGRDYER